MYTISVKYNLDNERLLELRWVEDDCGRKDPIYFIDGSRTEYDALSKDEVEAFDLMWERPYHAGFKTRTVAEPINEEF